MNHDQTNLPELIKLSAVEIVNFLKRGEVTPLDLLEELARRIAEVDSRVNALPTLCFDRARDFVAHWHKDELRETLLGGIPVAIKDLNDVAGVRTTFGSLVYEDNISETSDILVEHLEARGGVIYAKTNTPEFGTGANTTNKVFGATRNPWNNDLSAAGSSGGAAVALATGTAWLAHGSDMGGSLRNPASFCNIVGFRPTVGRVASTVGAQTFDTLSTNGPMARNVEDLALFLDAMSGRHPLDLRSLDSPAQPFREAVRQKALPEKVAFSTTFGGMTPVDPKVRQVILHAVEQIAAQGVEVEEASPDFSGLHDIFGTLRAFSYGTNYREILEQHRTKLNDNVIWNIEQGLSLTAEDISRAERMRAELVINVARFFQEYDLFLTPATIVPPYPVDNPHVAECDSHQFDNYFQWLAAAYAFTTAMCPALSMPCGFTENGLPVGLQVAAATKEDASVLSAAGAFEDIFGLTGTVPIHPR